MKKILFLNEMLTPKIITFVYWIGLLGVLLSSIVLMSKNKSTPAGFFVLVFGSIAVRVFCELNIVFFKIYENVKKLADKH